MSASSHRYGIMQGRLSPPEDGRFQSFPRVGWRDEFSKARAVGFDYIEWIHDAYGADVNPVFSEDGLREFDRLKVEFGISTPALCADWFMDFPLVRCSGEERRRRAEHLCELIPVAERIDAWRIVLPLVDASSMRSEEDKAMVLEVLERALPIATAHRVELHLEADLPPDDFRAFMARLRHASLRINWDSGNSAGLGYVASEEFAAYGERIGSIHIKDRYRKPDGSVETRPLGTGSADFADIFGAIRRIGYDGGLTLQVARGSPGREVEFLGTQLAFVENHR